MDDASARAREIADRAAEKASVEVRSLDNDEELFSLVRVLTDIWQAEGSENVIPQTLTKALAHAGNYVSGAFGDGQLVGGSIGFYGSDGRRLFLHSHITGVASSLQGRSVGFALKQHQRAWALSRGLDSITWTFDPLVRRNAYFNVTKLGAEIVDYKPNFYGAMNDGINGEDESDRCVVSWSLASTRALEAAEGKLAEATADPSKARPVLTESASGAPELDLGAGDVLLASIPYDIVQIRADDPPAASAWRSALRDVAEWAFDEGFMITGLTREGCYVFTRTG